jgi:hypothetical protein
VLSSFGVLKLLMDRSAIDIALVRKVTLQWQVDDDFREECPRLQAWFQTRDRGYRSERRRGR